MRRRGKLLLSPLLLRGTEANNDVGIGHLRRFLLFRMYAVGEGQGWVSEDYQLRQFEDGSILPEEEFQESLIGSCL